jgi:hypothetical protein
MKSAKILALAALIALGGCATCQQHPVACTIVGAVVVGSVVATIEANEHHRASPTSNTQPLNCSINPAACR